MAVIATGKDAVTGNGAVTRTATGFTHLSLTAFRNYRQLSLDLDPRPVMLWGDNGAGKTNLLEAISFFAPGSGLRQAKLAEVDFRIGSHGASNQSDMAWAVHARITLPRGEHLLGTGRDPLGPAQTGRDRRLHRLNSAPLRSQAGFAEILSVLWLTPQMDRLLSDATGSRRRFLDRLVASIDADQASRIGSYETTVRERAKLLRGEVAAGGADLAAWLDGLEAEIAGLAVAIAAARNETVLRLNDFMTTGAPHAAFPLASLAIDGAVESWLQEMPALAAEDRLRSCLQAARAEDAASGTTRWGTHRSDLAVTYLGRRLGDVPLRAGDCSSGEQKALLLSIILAQARLTRHLRGEAPILLLDEAMAHLDAGRRAALFEEVLALGTQAWLTGTERDWFKPLGDAAQGFAVSDGRLQAERV
ncbi:MAG: DNA replication/repair protein RecF [Rhodospirillaceae bacterium]|nr:MAG: DNA replication/repair protein RecF [Rhodospirillaceae bacterium]